ncbi:MAG: peptide MFS transporter [Armatimonadota bacterium]
MINNNAMKHPKGLYYLFSTEMWERFSYYGIMALMVLYMTKALGFTDKDADLIVGAYCAFTFLSPVLGGWLADNYLGYSRCVKLGGMGIFLGNLVLVLPYGTKSFFIGLALIIMGTGLLKSTVSVIVGQLYPKNDPRIDSAYTLFYMGINIGSTLAGILSYIGERVNWHYGFMLSAAGMLLGLFIFWKGTKYYASVSNEVYPDKLRQKFLGISAGAWIALGLILLTGIVAYLFWNPHLTGKIMAVLSGIILIYIVYLGLKCKGNDRIRVFAILIYVLFAAVFFALYMQINNSLILFMDRDVNRNMFGFNIPASTASLVFNAAAIVLFAPVFSWLWLYLGKIKKEPSVPLKFFIGMVLIAVSFLVFAHQAKLSTSGVPSTVWWTLLGMVIFSMAELCVSPVGLSMIIHLSPEHLAGILMGAWFMSSAFGGYLSGVIASLGAVTEQAAANISASSAVYLGLFTKSFYIMLACAFIFLIFVPFLTKITHSTEK